MDLSRPTAAPSFPVVKFRKPLPYPVAVVRCQLVCEATLSAESRNVRGPEQAVPLLRAHIGDSDREHFVALYLNARNNVIAIHTVSVGTLTASLVHPREVFKPAIIANAAGVIVAHNHPSGDAKPSAEDRASTKRLVDAGNLLGIPVLDHVILGESGHYSFREAGAL